MLRLLASGPDATGVELANQAVGSLRKTVDELAKAADGRFEEHHSFMLKLLLTQLEESENHIVLVESRIGAHLERYKPQVVALSRIPGVSFTVVWCHQSA